MLDIAGPSSTMTAVLFVVCGLWVFLLCIALDRVEVANRWNAGLVSLVWGLGVVWMTATRPVHYPSDMSIYLDRFTSVSEKSVGQVLRGDENDPGFSVFLWTLRQFGTSNAFFQTVVAAAICLLTWLSLRRLLDTVHASIAFFAATLFPFFVYYVTNTVRQGLAVGLLMYALSLVASRRSRTLVVVLVLAAAVGIHLSALIPALVIAALRFRRISIKSAFLVWLLGATAYLTGMNQRILAGIVGKDDRLTQYSESAAVRAYSGGVNRLDFLLLSAFLVGAAVWLTRARSREVFSPPDAESVSVLVPALVLINAYFLFFGFIAYSDRLAAFSWLLAPMVLGFVVLRRPSTTPSRGALLYVAAMIALCIVLQGWPDLLERTSIVS